MSAALHEPVSTAARTVELRILHDPDGASAFCAYQALIRNQECVLKLLLAMQQARNVAM